jgi:hypothetical protein
MEYEKTKALHEGKKESDTVYNDRKLWRPRINLDWLRGPRNFTYHAGSVTVNFYDPKYSGVTIRAVYLRGLLWVLIITRQ